MNVSTLAHRDVVACSDRDSAEEVAHRMWESDIGCLPVVDKAQRVVGIVTDRDLAMAAYLQGRPLRAIAVSTAMSREVVTCHERDRVADVTRWMRQRQIRRVPVVADDGTLRGMITLNDLVHAAAAGHLLATDVVHALAGISRPRRSCPVEDDAALLA
jgi:CBS domain-containing protein